MALFTPPDLTPDDVEVLAALAALQERVQYNVSKPRRWRGRLRRQALAGSLRGSNSIEGIDVSDDDAFAVVAQVGAEDASRETQAAVSGYWEAMTYILQLADDPDFAYSEALLKSLHFMVQKYDLDKWPGRYRPGSIYIDEEATGRRVYEGPSADHVGPLMEELIQSLEVPHRGDLPVVTAAMAHLNLVMIHPFRDGNGRMARALQTLVLARSGVRAPEFNSVEENLGHHHQAYYDVLSQVGRGRWSPSQDTRPWVRFMIVAHYHQATTVLQRVRRAELVSSFVDDLCSDKGVPERMLLAVEYVMSGRILTNTIYRTVVESEVSTNVASRDLKTLVDAGILEKVGDKRGARYLPVRQLRDEVVALWHASRNEVPYGIDPYQALRDGGGPLD